MTDVSVHDVLLRIAFVTFRRDVKVIYEDAQELLKIIASDLAEGPIHQPLKDRRTLFRTKVQDQWQQETTTRHQSKQARGLGSDCQLSETPDAVESAVQAAALTWSAARSMQSQYCRRSRGPRQEPFVYFCILFFLLLLVVVEVVVLL